MNQVQPWQTCSGHVVRGQEWSDDRLRMVWDALSDDQQWQPFETALNRQMARVSNLKPKRVRVESTTASGSWTATKEGRFQLGDRKDHRPDVPPRRVMLSALDPPGLPVATQIVSGERADDLLSPPAIEQVSQSLNEHGLLSGGDCKMAALETRACVQAQQDSSLCPLARKQLPEGVLAAYVQPVWAGTQSLTTVTREREARRPELMAEGDEQTVTVSGDAKGKTITWTERHPIVRSIKLAQARLTRTRAEVGHLNEHLPGKKRSPDVASLQQAAQAILKEHRVGVTIEEQVEERRIRTYGNRSAGVRVARAPGVRAEVDAPAVEEATCWLGWRVSATTQPKEALPLEQAVLASRDAYLGERGFGRVRGKPLSLSPMDVQRDQRARLLSMGLRLLTLLEFRVRQGLADTRATVAGLSAGNPKRTANRPPAEALLGAFQGMHVSLGTSGQQLHRHITSLSEVQQHLFVLLGVSPDLSDQLCADVSKPT